MKRRLIYYRGPLERSRLSFIIEACQDDKTKLSFLWLFPGKMSEEKKSHSMSFLSQFDFEMVEVREERPFWWLRSNLAFRSFLLQHNFESVYLVGFSAPFFGLYKGKTKRIWFINGVPEEKSLHGNALFYNLVAKVLWKLQGLSARCSMSVTVSSRMSDYVTMKTGIKNTFFAPCCTDLETFRPKEPLKERKYFSYLGTGAPWQALDILEKIWFEIYTLNNSVRFRIISRDERCKILSKRIPEENIEMVSSNDFSTVAGFLHESEVGFLLRKPSIVNKVCFPTKLGEYLTAGMWVVSSDIDWDVKDLFLKYDIGVIVDPASSPKIIAQKILDYKSSLNKSVYQENLKQASDYLEKKHWIDALKVILQKI